MKQAIVFALLIGTAGIQLGMAQESKPKSPEAKPPAERRESSPDLDAIRVGSQAFVAAFN